MSDWWSTRIELHQRTLAPRLPPQLGDEQGDSDDDDDNDDDGYDDDDGDDQVPVEEDNVIFRETVHNGKKLFVTRIGLRIRLTRDHFHWGKLKVAIDSFISICRCPLSSAKHT